MASRLIKISGFILDKETKKSIGGLKVEAWDKDLLIDDFIGSGTTDKEGRFVISFTRKYFSELFFDRKPDLFFKVFKKDQLIYSSEEHVLWNIERDKDDIVLMVPAGEIPTDDGNEKPVPGKASLQFSGLVKHSNGNVIAGITVLLNEKKLRSAITLNKAVTDTKGLYSILINKATPNTVYEVTVVDAKGKTLASSGNLFNAAEENEVNFVVADITYKGSSFFAQLSNTLEAYRVKLANTPAGQGLTVEDIQLIAHDSNTDEREVWYWLHAHVLSNETTVDAEVFYGWFKQDFPTNIENLYAYAPESLIDALEDSAFDNYISDAIFKKADQYIISWNNYLTQKAASSKPAGTGASIKDILSIAIENEGLHEKVLTAYTYHTGTTEEFWNNLPAITGDETVVPKLQRSLLLTALTGNQPAMISRLYNELENDGSVNAIQQLAARDAKDWITYITEVSTQTGKSAVPDSINANTEKERVEKYAEKLSTALGTLYPTPAFAGRLAKDLSHASAFAATKNDLVLFFKNNPDFDLKSSVTYDPGPREINYQFNDIANKEELVTELRTIQRLGSYTTNYQEMSNMKKAGFDSASGIMRVPKEEFAKKGKILFGSEERALDIYARAAQNYMTALGLWGNWHPSLHSTTPTPLAPNLVNLFGSQDACDCEHCNSVFSPAAYLADCLNWLYKYEVAGLQTDVYTELVRRRPDIPFIKLNCDNANTPMPYVDLVIELLENFVLTHKAAPKVVPSSYQTTWKAAELVANPEHLDYDAYTELLTAVYPNPLPFHFPLEETRIYLKHLGTKRHDLMTTFYKGKPEQAFDDFDNCMERLNISLQESRILTGETSGSAGAGSGVFNFYGIDSAAGFTPLTDPTDSSQTVTAADWIIMLSSRVDVFLKQTGITYRDMLGLLNCNFINPGGVKITITAVAPAAPDTCELDKLSLTGLDDASLRNIHRLLRLWQKTGWHMHDLDRALKAFGIVSFNDVNNPVNITAAAADLKKIAQAEFLRSRLNISLPEMLAFWSDIDSHSRYVDYFSDNYPPVQSLYAKLFRNKSVLKTINDISLFTDDPGLLPGGVIDANTKTWILAALEISDNDYSLLTDAASGIAKNTLDITNLSLLFRFSLLAKKLNYTVKDFLYIKNMIGIADPFKNPLETFTFLLKTDLLKSSGFSIDLLRYILQHEFEAETQVAAAEDVISVFLSELRAALRAVRSETEEKQRNTIAQKFSEKLKITSLSSTELLRNIPGIAAAKMEDDYWAADFETVAFLKTYTDPLDATKEVEPLFVSTASTTAGAVLVSGLFDNYRKIEKAASLINKLKLSDAEIVLILKDAAAIGCLDLKSLPVVKVKGDFNAFEILIHLIQARDLLPAGRPLLSDILNSVLHPAAGSTVPQNKQDWLDAIIKRTNWDREILETLAGTKAAGDNGILNKVFPADFNNGDVLLQVKNCFTTIKRLGLKPSVIELTIKIDPNEKAAEAVKNAAKAKYNEAQWLKNAKPLRNELREKQREALVAYVLAHSDFKAPRFERWKNRNELYQHLLIDVEMKPLTLTSRIKQAICSVQLYIDRILMNLEHINSDPSSKPPLALPAGKVKEWNEWRKIYRVWEANRKIFLYPENWIEESLRDNKSPFFQNLETLLQQNELNKENTEDGFFAFLENVDEVARLEVVSFYHQVEAQTAEEEAIDTLHVFARTYGHPQKYFHRTLENCTKPVREWTPWKKMEIDIDGDHLVPVVFNRRLCLFWLFFTQKAEQNKGLKLQTGTTLNNAPIFWKIQVGWSEYKKGRWTAKRLSKAAVESEHFFDRPFMVSPPGAPVTSYPEKIAAVDLASCRAQLLIRSGVLFDWLIIDLSSGPFKFQSETIPQQVTDIAFLFSDTNSEPVISTFSAFPTSIGIQEGAINEMMFTANNNNQSFIIEDTKLGNELSVLDKGKDIFRIAFSPVDSINPFDKRFFYQDSQNVFYVERKAQSWTDIFQNPRIINFRNMGAAAGAIYGPPPPPPPEVIRPETYFLNKRVPAKKTLPAFRVDAVNVL